MIDSFSPDEKRIPPEVEVELLAVWNNVFKVINKILSGHEKFGFKLIEKNINPSLEDMIFGLRILNGMLEKVGEVGDYAVDRMLINAKQQICWVEQLVSALRNGMPEDYDLAIKNLRAQAQV